jgi:hypothetical protein
MPQMKRPRDNTMIPEGPGHRLTAHPLDHHAQRPQQQPHQTMAMAIAERLHHQRVLAAARLSAERMARAEERHGSYYVGHALAPTEEAMENDLVGGFWFNNMPSYYNTGYDEFDLPTTPEDATSDVEMY